jgi:glycosyltransferase involved in cell wall biosynthesis
MRLSFQGATENRANDESVDIVTPARLPITVVIPTYNREDHIGATLESVRAQTAQPHEILVVDDSTDNTAAIAARYGAKVIPGAHAGVSAARNIGIIAAAQPWVAFLDSDDLWLPDKLALQWEALRLCPRAQIVFSDFSQFDDAGETLSATLPSYSAYSGMKRIQTAPGMYCCDDASMRDAVSQTNFMLTSSLVVRRDLLMSAGLFDPAMCHREDYELLLRLVNVAKVALVERPLVRYRHGSPNSLANQWLNMLRARSLIADRVIRCPDRYPPAALERFSRRQPLWLRGIGVRSLEAGEFDAAVNAFHHSLQRRFSIQALLWYAAAWSVRAAGGFHLYRGLRAAKRLAKRIKP